MAFRIEDRTASRLAGPRGPGEQGREPRELDGELANGELAQGELAKGELAKELTKIDALWRAANYLSVGQIHELTYRRASHGNFHVHGYREEGTTTTPFDMVVLNHLDRFHLALAVIDRLPQLGPRAAYFRQAIRDRLIDHRHYIEQHGEDMPEITGWRWERGATPETPRGAGRGAATSTEGDQA